MKKAVIALVLIIGVVVFTNAQSSLNDYKYVVVPHFYEFVKGKDTYRLNTITRFLLKKKGLNAFMEEEIKALDYRNNSCLALTTEVISLSSMLKTRLKVILKNCDGEVVFESKVGESKSKDYEVAYKGALNMAIESFDSVNYEYTPNDAILSRADKDESAIRVSEAETKVEKLKAELKELKGNKNSIEKKVELVQEIPLPEIQTERPKENSKMYFKARPITNGFELINSNSNKVEYIIHTATIPNMFMIKNKKGIIYKKDGKWVREYVDGEKTMIEALDIRF